MIRHDSTRFKNTPLFQNHIPHMHSCYSASHVLRINFWFPHFLQSRSLSPNLFQVSLSHLDQPPVNPRHEALAYKSELELPARGMPLHLQLLTHTQTHITSRSWPLRWLFHCAAPTGTIPKGFLLHPRSLFPLHLFLYYVSLAPPT